MAGTELSTLALSLATAAVKAGASRLPQPIFGPAQERKLKELLGASIQAMLDELTRSGELAGDTDYVSDLRIRLTNFFSDEEVAGVLISLAIAASEVKPLPLAHLRELYERRGYDPDAFPVTFERAMNVCAVRLVRGVKEEASADGSPLNNLIEVSKLYSIEETLQEVLRRAESTGPTADELERESWARCKRRWTLLGVSPEEAEALAKNPTVGAPDTEARVRLGRPVAVIAAEVGAGKSLLLDRLMQRAIVRYRESEDAPLPVFVEATEVKGKLREVVVERTESLDSSAKRGAAIFVDGLEEAGRARARQLLDEAHYLSDMWPNTTVVVAGRLIQELEEERERGEAVALPKLTEEETAALIRRFSGEPRVVGVYGWPESVRQAVKLPLFATLVGLDMRNRYDRDARSGGELLSHLVDRALRRADEAVEVAELRRLAVAITDRGGGRIRRGDAGTWDEVRRLRGTGLVHQEGGALRFSLQILSEWFAAQALELGDVDAKDLASDFTRLERWRYPLIMAVGNFGYERVLEILEPVVHAAPGFASQLVDEALGGGHAEEGVSEDVDEVAAQFRRTMGAWVEGLGPLAPFCAPVKGDGTLGTLAISSQEGRGNYAWYAGQEELPEVVPFWRVADTELRFGVPQRNFAVGRQDAWAWRRTFKDLRGDLEEALKVGKLPAATPMLAREAGWRAAKDLLLRTQSKARSEKPVALQEIEGCLDELDIRHEDWISIVPPGSSRHRFYEVHCLVEEVRRLRASGQTEMTSPVPIDGRNRAC